MKAKFISGATLLLAVSVGQIHAHEEQQVQIEVLLENLNKVIQNMNNIIEVNELRDKSDLFHNNALSAIDTHIGLLRLHTHVLENPTISCMPREEFETVYLAANKISGGGRKLRAELRLPDNFLPFTLRKDSFDIYRNFLNVCGEGEED